MTKKSMKNMQVSFTAALVEQTYIRCQNDILIQDSVWGK